jgi:uncharacterized protein YhbP (UPF0306 family)
MKVADLAIVEITDPGGEAIASIELGAEQVRDSIFQILAANVLCSMATVTGDHEAHINTAYFCYSADLALYFLSHPNSDHGRNLTGNSSMAITIFSSSQTWAEPDAGLQLFGHCAPATGAQATMAEALYSQRFPAYVDWQQGLGEDEAANAYRFYRFVARRVKILDERNLGDAVFVSAVVKGERR